MDRRGTRSHRGRGETSLLPPFRVFPDHVSDQDTVEETPPMCTTCTDEALHCFLLWDETDLPTMPTARLIVASLIGLVVLVIVVLVVLALVKTDGCEEEDGACENNGDCCDDLVCSDQTCRPPLPPLSECGQHAGDACGGPPSD
eukprot:scaffold11890_cov33-Tisochrysis_lutea.AAC.2